MTTTEDYWADGGPFDRFAASMGVLLTPGEGGMSLSYSPCQQLFYLRSTASATRHLLDHLRKDQTRIPDLLLFWARREILDIQEARRQFCGLLETGHLVPHQVRGAYRLGAAYGLDDLREALLARIQDGRPGLPR